MIFLKNVNFEASTLQRNRQQQGLMLEPVVLTPSRPCTSPLDSHLPHQPVGGPQGAGWEAQVRSSWLLDFQFLSSDTKNDG